MSVGAGLKVHVIPVGWEYDRAVRPFLLPNSDPRKQHAHRVYMVVPGMTGARRFPERIQKALEGEGIEVRLREVERQKDGRSVEFESTLQEIAGICHDEAFRSTNDVHINISSGSKIGAFASGLAGMAYQQTGRVHLYYVQPENYTETEKEPAQRDRMWRQSGLSVGLKDVLDLQLIPIVQYTRPQLQVLAHLRANDGRATLQDVLQHLIIYPEGDFDDFVDLLDVTKAKAHRIRQTPRATHRSKAGKPIGDLRELQNRALGRLRTLTKQLHDEGWVRTDRSKREYALVLTEAGKVFALLAQDESARL